MMSQISLFTCILHMAKTPQIAKLHTNSYPASSNRAACVDGTTMPGLKKNFTFKLRFLQKQSTGRCFVYTI